MRVLPPVLGLGLLLMGQVLARAVPAGLMPVKYLLGVGIFLSVLVYVLGLLFLPAAQEAGDQSDTGRGVSYTAMRRGGLGGGAAECRPHVVRGWPSTVRIHR